MRNPTIMKAAIVIGAAGFTIFVTVMMITAAPRLANANADMAKATGQPCAKCHTAAPALNNYGKKYKDRQKH